MKPVKNILAAAIFLFPVFFIFRNWFIHPEILGGDWPYIYPEKLKETALIPPSWNSVTNNGFGGVSPLYSLQSFHQFTIFLSNFFSWVIVYEIFWFGLFIVLSVISAWYFIKTLIPEINLFGIFSAVIIYSSNTYILMVTGGGQMGVALAYSLTPFVIALFIKLIDRISLKNKFSVFLPFSLKAGFILSLQILFDPRLAYISLIAVFLYFIFSLKKNLKLIFSILIFVFFLPFLETIFLHAFWILPSVLFHYNPTQDLGSAFTGEGAFKFFSFADFSHSFSLLHPNWPENIFGKTYFLDPLFLVLPIIGYACLYFTGKKNNSKVLFFTLLGLIGVFLSKGINEPFGFINSWMFVHVPGFILFRDPTKFYMLIALSYCLIIPYSLFEFSNNIFEIKKKRLKYLPFILFIVFWLYLIRPAVLGKLGGTFASHSIPDEYFTLEHYLSNRPGFFRTLWVPRQQRFSFFTDNHPAVEAEPLFNATNSAQIITKLSDEKNKNYLQNLGIKYVIVPYDSFGELFVKDRKYNEKEYLEVIAGIRKISWLKEIPGFGKIIVFSLQDSKDHFWLTNGEISSKLISPDEYFVSISVKNSATMIFVENYSPYWVAKSDKLEMASQKTTDNFNSFYIPKKGNFVFKVYFKEREYFIIGWIISGTAFLSILLIMVYNRFFGESKF